MSRAKRIVFVFALLLAIIASLGGIKALQIRQMIAAASTFKQPAETVTVATASQAEWESRLTATGSLAAVQGVTVSAELPGKIVEIAFKPGAKVRAGALLVKQDTSSERAQLRAVLARLTLARINLKRSERLVAHNVVARAQLDDVRAQAAQAAAEADTVRAAITKKIIRAPFAGRLGIRLVNLGEVIASGTPIVSLQSTDSVYANFALPQQQLAKIRPGLEVRLKTNAVPKEVEGTITAVNPQVSANTRTVEVQATVRNPDERLRPGMFVEVAVLLPARKPVLAIPAPAVLYAPYGDSVFVVQGEGGASDGQRGGLIAHQQFVRLGERRGDFVAVTGGLKAGQRVVSTGVFKLRNGQAVVVDNTLTPRFQLAPTPSDG